MTYTKENTSLKKCDSILYRYKILPVKYMYCWTFFFFPNGQEIFILLKNEFTIIVFLVFHQITFL